MTKRQSIIFLVMITILFSTYLNAQTGSLTSIAQTHIDYQQRGMMILGGWGLSNAIIGGYAMTKTTGEAKYFNQMNVGWGLVNAGIAALGYFSTKNTSEYSDIQTLLGDHHSIKNVLLFNGGLDVGYMLGGLYLIERSKNDTKNPLRLKGFGKSILLQGAFLFAFDLGSFAIHNSLTKELHQQVTFQSNGQGLGLLYQF